MVPARGGLWERHGVEAPRRNEKRPNPGSSADRCGHAARKPPDSCECPGIRKSRVLYSTFGPRAPRRHKNAGNSPIDLESRHGRRLVDENQAIVTETLNVRGMLRNRRLARAIADGVVDQVGRICRAGVCHGPGPPWTNGGGGGTGFSLAHHDSPLPKLHRPGRGARPVRVGVGEMCPACINTGQPRR